MPGPELGNNEHESEESNESSIRQVFPRPRNKTQPSFVLIRVIRVR